MIGFIPEQSQTDRTAKDLHIASHALVFMVVGVTSNIKMSLGYFPTKTATGLEIFKHMWKAIGLPETCCNLKVIASTSDKATSNMKMIKMHGGSHKTKNLFAKDRYIYFFSDAPHLVKTVRNNISSSGWGRNTRHLWNNGSEILWSYIKNLYDDDQSRELKRCPKLTSDHIFLKPQSSMRVYLAAQVLSHTVGNVMKTFGNEESLETAKFVLLMDKFFDCLNTRSVSEGHQKSKAFLLPYTSSEDQRFQFLTDEFLGYLEKWKSSVIARPGFSTGEKEKMFLSSQTYKGLKINVKSLIGATKYLLENGVCMILSNKFCQDPLEEHFSRHRGMGVRAENKTLWTYGYQEIEASTLFGIINITKG